MSTAKPGLELVENDCDPARDLENRCISDAAVATSRFGIESLRTGRSVGSCSPAEYSPWRLRLSALWSHDETGVRNAVTEPAEACRLPSPSSQDHHHPRLGDRS